MIVGEPGSHPSSGVVTVRPRTRGLGTLQGPIGGELRYEAGGSLTTLPVGNRPGAVASACLVTRGGVPWWWLGWGPAYLAEIQFLDSEGRELLVIPAGSGWVGSEPSHRYASSIPRVEHAPRLVPVWDEDEIRSLASACGFNVSEVDGPWLGVLYSLNDIHATGPSPSVHGRWRALLALALFLGFLAFMFVPK